MKKDALYMHTITRTVAGIWHIKAPFHGPSLALTGGLHGNERTGIEVVQRLVQTFTDNSLQLMRGELILALGNPRAIAQNTRGSVDGADLNRCFTPEVLQGSGGGYEVQRARELARALRMAMVGIDLHATNAPSTPFVMSQAMPSVQGHAIARCLHASYLLTDPDWIFAGTPVTLDEYVARSGGFGLCYETGLAQDLSRVDEVEQEMLNVLRLLGMVRGSPTLAQIPQDIYRLRERIELGPDGFCFAKGLGQENFQAVSAGQVIGLHGDVPQRATRTGVIIFPKPIPMWELGKPVGYLASKV